MSLIVLASFFAGTAYAEKNADTSASQKIGIFPPELDYKKICVQERPLTKDNFDWTGKTVANSGLTDAQLSKRLKLYYHGSGSIPPNYQLAYDIAEHLIKSPTKEMQMDGLSVEYDMLLKGRYLPQNNLKAKAVLDKLIALGDATAYSRYGDLYMSEANYAKAAEFYRKAYTGGEKTAAIKLAYLYHDKKILVSDEEIINAIKLAEEATMQYLTQGNCHALTLFGAMYARLNNYPNTDLLSAKWFEKAALLDDPSAKLSLAEVIQRGFRISYDKARILELWREAADLGSDRAMYLLGEAGLLDAKNDKEIEEAISWLTKAIQRRNLQAMQLLAGVYDGRYPAFKDAAKQQKILEDLAVYPEAKDKALMQLAALYEKDGTIPREKIFDLYLRAAGKGNKTAYLKLGDAYRYGIGVKEDPVRSLRYYRLAAAGGDTTAMKALKEEYQCGVGISNNPKQVRFWSSQLDYFDSASVIDAGYAAVLSPVTDADAKKKLQTNMMLLAVSRSDVEAMILLGLMHERDGDKKKAQEWYQKAFELDKIKQDDYSGTALLGEITLEGEYRAKNEEEGIKMLLEAASHGNTSAENALGEWYMAKGQIDQAISHFKLASKDGKPSTQMGLAKAYIKKNQVPDAIAIFEDLAARHNVKAMIKLAEGYDKDGWIGTEDSVKARDWFNKAAKSSPCEISEFLSIIEVYRDGKFGIEKNPAEAEKWLSLTGDMVPDNDKDRMKLAKAILTSALIKDEAKRNAALSLLEQMADRNNREALSFLSQLYLDKNFAGYNPDKALIWITRDAENGGVNSMMELANMYASGYGVPASVEKAVYWLEKASAAGNVEAKQRLQNIRHQ